MHPGRLVVVSSIVLAGAVSAGAQRPAEPGFNGTWRLNVAKSQLSGIVYTLTKKPSGEWHYFSGVDFMMDFYLEGPRSIAPRGFDFLGREVSPTAWELTHYLDGKVTSRSQLTLKGDLLLRSDEHTYPERMTYTRTDTRVSGGPGFEGHWRSGLLNGSTPSMQISVKGSDITVSAPDFQKTVKASFDGKDYPSVQSGQPTTLTQAFTRAGANTIKMTTKESGKPYSSEVWTLSADGKVITIESTLESPYLVTKEKQRSVFERVSNE